MFLSLSLSLSGQRSSDYGVFTGISSYMSDFNPDSLFYHSSWVEGIIYRYNLHPRQALRTNIFVSNINTSNNSKTVLELALQYEFNFFPYSTEGKQWNYTPYFAAGAGIAYIDIIRFVIPFSFGFKVNIYKNVGLEAEYGFRKTFIDNFDGLNGPAHSRFYNNDWYSFLGVGVTWKMFSKLESCRVYNEGDLKRKR